MAQTFNNILSYIKLEMGAKYSLLEFTDDEMVENLRDHVLIKFSQYAPFTSYVYINDSNQVNSATGHPIYKYTLPVPSDTRVIDILDVYYTQGETAITDYGNFVGNYDSAIDVVMTNTFVDALKSLGSRQTWEFELPNKIIFDKSINSGAIVQFSTPHKTLETIRPDLYEEVFKDMCLAKIKLWIAALRNKFDQLATPVATIGVNWEKLESDGRELWEKCEQKLQTLPPDHLVICGI